MNTSISGKSPVKLYIRYMVTLRCKIVVRDELARLGLNHANVEMGVVEVFEEITEAQRAQLKINLQRTGLELLEDKRSALIERIKNVIIEMVYHAEEVPKVNFSDYISEKLGYDYTYLSNIFSEVKGITIQQFIIMNKIEKVKDLLMYDELNLTEISFRLNYSSVAHLSNQFKKATGLSPSFYRELKKRRGVIQQNL
jgi:AraC-like DNA-binding protein